MNLPAELERDGVLGVACPRCHAKPGDKCAGAVNLTFAFHASRIRAALTASEASETKPVAINPDFDPNAALKVLREIRRESDVRGYLPDEELVNVLVTKFGDLDDFLSNRGPLPAAWRRTIENPNWTDGDDGTTNSSQKFIDLEREIGRMIRANASSLLEGRSEEVGRLILARLAHAHGLAPGGSK